MTWSYEVDPLITSFPALARSRMEMGKLFIRNSDGREFSYAEIWRIAGGMAQALVDCGVQKGDRVAVQVEKSPEVIALFLACARAGAVFLPLNTAYTPAELEYFLRNAEPHVFVVAPASEEALTALARQCGVAKVLTLGIAGNGTLMDAAERSSADFACVPARWDDPIAILYTSGTTGRSKGAVLTHANLASNALTLVDTWRFTADDVLLHALPIYHTHGLFTATNTLMLSGGTMLFRPRFDAEEALALFPQVTTMMGVPTFYTRLLQHPGLNAASTAHMRLFISGSAPLRAETHEEFFRRNGHAILERYGMTETNMNTSNPYDGDRLPGTVGFPLAGTSLRISDPVSREPLPQGEIGVIQVSGPNVFKGYWRLPDVTAQDFTPDGYFITGDLGRIDERGYVSIVGRGKDLIISGGFNVYPKEVEREIDGIEGVLESAVIGLPHKDFGEGVTAVIVPEAGRKLDAEAMLETLAARLAKFKLPKKIIIVDELPRNAMGKVQKALLRERYACLYE